MGILHPFLGDHPQRVKRGVLTTIAGELRPMMFWGRQWGKEVFGVGAGTGQWLVSVNSLSSVMRFSAQTCIYETRVKAPRAWRPPRGKPKARMCARVHPRLRRLTHTTPMWTPIWRTPATASLCPSGPVLHPQDPLVSRSHRTDEMCRTAGHTSVLAPLQTLCFLSAHLLGGHGL